ncbi:helix-turn-helix transcriptional regulator [Bacillaceae bacterium S4-13-56]
MEGIGETLRFVRKKNGLSQEKVAKEICSISYLSKLETGKIQGSDEIVTLLFQKLKIPIKLNEDNSIFLTIVEEKIETLYKQIINN